MEKRPFGKPPPESGFVTKEPLKSELFTKIGTRTAVITAHYEHVHPPVSQALVQTEAKLKQVTFLEDKVEPIYDVPNSSKVTKL